MIIVNFQLPIADLISNWQSAMLLISAVWQHRNHAFVVRLRYEHVDIQVAFSLIRLLCQYVPRMRMATLDLSAGR
jgi:hypothetical protein